MNKYIYPYRYWILGITPCVTWLLCNLIAYQLWTGKLTFIMSPVLSFLSLETVFYLTASLPLLSSVFGLIVAIVSLRGLFKEKPKWRIKYFGKGGFIFLSLLLNLTLCYLLLRFLLPHILRLILPQSWFY